ncbi:hypothetical protein VKT23_015770 [Stygiomarasmius scandens]|uniref:Uncharacterized protein n=1 Tax=Marasmiellus scandens TaxID=2682957 RepID=A0ABR1IWN0_9AGAR
MAYYMRIGIAFFARNDAHGRPTNLHWTIVANKITYSYDSDRTVIYQIAPTPGFMTGWRYSSGFWNPIKDPSCVGVLHVGVIYMTSEDLTRYAKTYNTAQQDERDLSGLERWGPEAWVIRFLGGLVERDCFDLPWKVPDLYAAIVKKRLPILKRASQAKGVPDVIDINNL